MPLPTNYTNDTPSQDQHPGAHNQTNAAVNANETAIAANATALGRLPKGRLANLSITLSGAGPWSISTPTLTITGRYLRMTVALLGRITPGNTALGVDVTGPGVAEYMNWNVVGGAQNKTFIGVVGGQPSGNGTVTMTVTGAAGITSLVGTINMFVDDMGAV